MARPKTLGPWESVDLPLPPGAIRMWRVLLHCDRTSMIYGLAEEHEHRWVFTVGKHIGQVPKTRFPEPPLAWVERLADHWQVPCPV